MRTLTVKIVALVIGSAVLVANALAAPPRASPRSTPRASSPSTPPAAPPSTPPAVEEVREFEVFIKDKPAGKSTMRITDAADGAIQVATEVKVELNYLVYVYRYDYHGRETWRGGRLVSAENRATDDGQQFAARLQAGARGARIESNGQVRTVPTVDLSTNYWCGPDLARGAEFSVMNADRGTLHAVRVERIGAERVVVGGRPIACTHLRISGETEADLWVDRGNRLVRQKTVEDGYPTELRLARITRVAPRVADRGRTSPRR